MAVVPGSVEFHWSGSTGSVDRSGPVEYTALYRIQTDDALDQAQTIIVWWQTNQFPLGTPYTYANDALGSLATLANISATRVNETNTHWIVECRYSVESEDDKQDENDENTNDPLEYRPIIRCSSNSRSKVASLLSYRGGFSSRVSDKIGTAPTTPCNSIRIPYDPLPEIDEFLWYVSVESNVATFDANLSYVGYTNSEPFTVDYKGFTRGPVVQYQSKIRDCECEFMRENSVDFWKIRYYIEILPDQEDYFFRLPDISMHVEWKDGEPDGHGGTFGQGQGQTPDIPGRSHTSDVIDANGFPVRGPVPFDGDGKVADTSAVPFVPKYGVWWEDKEIDFNTLPIVQDILAPVVP